MEKFEAIYYHSAWNSYAKNFQIIDIPKCVNNIVYGCWFINYDGTIISTDSWQDTDKIFDKEMGFARPHDANGLGKHKFHGNFRELKKLKIEKELNVSLMLGEIIIENFINIIKNQTNQINFIYNLVNILKYYDVFNGVTFDLVKISEIIIKEHNDDFIILLKRLRKAFNSNNMSKYTISLCCNPDGKKCNFNIKIISNIVDRLYIMTFDFSKSREGQEEITIHHSNPRRSKYSIFSCEDSINYYLSFSKSQKLFISGVTYSRGFFNTKGLGYPGIKGSPDISWEKGKVDYKDLPKQNAIEYIDDESKAAYSYDHSKQIFNSYDNKDSIIEKCKIVKEKNLGGIFIYDDSGDKDFSHPNSIIKTINENFNFE